MYFEKYFRFPFNWKNPVGFLAGFALATLAHWNITHFVVCGITTGMGIFILLNSLTKDIKNDFIAFNDRLRVEPNPMILYKQLIDCIQFQSTIVKYDKIVI